MSTVEEIVVDIQGGADRKNELYKAIYKFHYKLCKKYLRFASDFGWEFDDLMSAAWFGTERAINDFDPDKDYKFITYLGYHVVNAIHEFLGIRNGKRLRHNISLDEELPGTEQLTYGDTIEDDGSRLLFENAEKGIYFRVLLEELEKLPQNNRETIKQFYFGNEDITRIADNLKVSKKDVKQYKQKALDELRKNKKIKETYGEEVEFKHTTLAAFRRTWTSSTELAALRIMDTLKQ